MARLAARRSTTRAWRARSTSAIEAGQFLKAEPGAARLLGVLSLQSLPRRLALDFRDLFEEGFAFDSVTGDVAIAQGVAQHQQPAHARRCRRRC